MIFRDLSHSLRECWEWSKLPPGAQIQAWTTTRSIQMMGVTGTKGTCSVNDKSWSQDIQNLVCWINLETCNFITYQWLTHKMHCLQMSKAQGCLKHLNWFFKQFNIILKENVFLFDYYYMYKSVQYFPSNLRRNLNWPLFVVPKVFLPIKMYKVE